MLTIAERPFSALFTATEGNAIVSVSRVFDRCDARVFVAAITERLLSALAASAPEIA